MVLLLLGFALVTPTRAQTYETLPWSITYMLGLEDKIEATPVIVNETYIANVLPMREDYSTPPPLVGDLEVASGFWPSCVKYVKSRRPDQTEPWGTPNKVSVTPLVFPEVGMILVTTESELGTRTGHAAIIEAVSGSAMIISEANFKGDYISTRSIDITNPVIRGVR